MVKTFEQWAIEFAEQLKAFIKPENGFTRNHPKLGPSGVVAERDIDNLAYAAVGKLQAYRNAVIRMVQDEMDSEMQEYAKILRQSTMITRLFQWRKFRDLKIRRLVITRSRVKLQNFQYKLRELAGDDLRVSLEEQKIINKK
jgi:hypothetical protein